jgi:hypothetical protein
MSSICLTAIRHFAKSSGGTRCFSAGKQTVSYLAEYKFVFLKIRNSSYLKKKGDQLGTYLLCSGLQKYRQKESVIEILIMYKAYNNKEPLIRKN